MMSAPCTQARARRQYMESSKARYALRCPTPRKQPLCRRVGEQVRQPRAPVVKWSGKRQVCANKMKKMVRKPERLNVKRRRVDGGECGAAVSEAAGEGKQKTNFSFLFLLLDKCTASCGAQPRRTDSPHADGRGRNAQLYLRCADMISGMNYHYL
jgi:hypothetical protein